MVNPCKLTSPSVGTCNFFVTSASDFLFSSHFLTLSLFLERVPAAALLRCSTRLARRLLSRFSSTMLAASCSTSTSKAIRKRAATHYATRHWNILQVSLRLPSSVSARSSVSRPCLCRQRGALGFSNQMFRDKLLNDTTF